MGDFLDDVSKQKEKKQEKQQFAVNRQLTQEFTNAMKPELELEQSVKKQKTMDFEQLNFENLAEKKVSEVPVQKENFEMLNMSKFAAEQKEENAGGNQAVNAEKEDKEMKHITALKGLLSTIRDKKYGTSDDKGTWYIIQSSGEAFLKNIENKSDQERGEELAELLKSAQRYLGTHKGKRFTKKGRDRVDFAKSIVKSVSDILQSFTMEGRVVAVDAILQKQNEVSQPGEAEAKELNKQFFTEYAKKTLKDDEDYITDKTFILMHKQEQDDVFGKSMGKITGGTFKESIYSRMYNRNPFAKNVILTRNGDIRTEDAHDAKLTEINTKRLFTCDPEEAPYMARSAFIKMLSQCKITPDMFTREYMDNHYIELRQLADYLYQLQNVYTDWKGRHGELAEKEYRSWPDAIQKKLDAICKVGSWMSMYLKNYEHMNCYLPNGEGNQFRPDLGKLMKNVKNSDIPKQLDKIKDEKKKWNRIERMAEGDESTQGVDYLYGKIELGNGQIKVVDILDADLHKIKSEYEKYKDNMEFTEEDFKTIQYFNYSEEAKKESERQGIDITPEAVAFSKMSKMTDDFIKKEKEKPENKSIQEILKGDFEKMYVKKLRFVKYNNSGEPATEEDKKNLEWNQAFAKSITENKQEDRVNLLKENYKYAAELINRVDFDRVLDFDYWNNNKDLYINLYNCCINGNMNFHSDSLFEEDREAIKVFLRQYNVMANLLNDFQAAFHAMSNVHGMFGNALGVDEFGEYMKAKMPGYENTKDIVDGIMGQEMRSRFEDVKKSNMAYIASQR